MKYLHYKIYTFVLGMVLLTGCEEYLDINTNPNAPEKVSAPLLMAHVSLRTGNNHQAAGDITSYYVQYLAGPNAGGTADTHVPESYDVTWRDLYRLLADISDMELAAEEEGLIHHQGAAKILKAINLGILLDLWGDLPYKKAFFAETFQPEYDDDQELYDELLALLDDGIALLKQPVEEAGLIGSEDFIYGGNVDGWIRMAYSLKARYLLHLSKTSAFDPQAVLAAVDNGIASNAQNGDVSYFTTGPSVYNPWATVARNQENLILDGWLSQQLVDAMDGTTFGVGDPRMPFMFSWVKPDPEADSVYIGVPNGAGRGSGVAVEGQRSTLVRGTYYASDDSPVLIITLAETKFIEAEAALAANDNARAYQAYLDGIAAHMEMLGVEEGKAEAYINHPVVSVGEDNITLALIMKEKYVAMFLHPEAWTDARRFDYQYEDMELPANQHPAVQGQWVRRMAYPSSEASRNRQNVPDVVTTDRLWWDQ